MLPTPITLRLVVASPNDVSSERDLVPFIAEELNSWMGSLLGLQIEVLRWETDAYPGFHIDGPQGLIDSILRIEDSDLLVGIFWKRFGTPLKDGATGTEHELLKAYESWKKDGNPQVMMYFKQKSYSPTSKEETDQWGRVLEFKRKFPAEGLWWPYNSKVEFERLLRSHLINLIRHRYLSGLPQLVTPTSPGAHRLQLLPPAPKFLVGREQGLQQVKKILGIGKRTAEVAVLRGLPGIGKSSLAAALAYDVEVQKNFPDGILWTTLGQTPNLFSALTTWGEALQADEVLRASTLKDIANCLKGALNSKRMLLIVDDTWEKEHAVSFLHMRGSQCGLLFTTRETWLAETLAPSREEIYNVPVLDENSALELLSFLAPTVMADYKTDCEILVRDLEFLPLAIHVAGRTLNTESALGWTIKDLLSELRTGSPIIKSSAPPDRADIQTHKIPTVQALFRQSTDRLKPLDRKCFAKLAPFAPKPASFDLDALKAVWKTHDPKPCIRELVNRGLMEAIDGRFQVHALLIAHALTLWEG